MIHRGSRVVAGVVLVLAAACGDQPAEPPSQPTVERLDGNVAAVAISCDFRTLKRSINGYFLRRDKKTASAFAKTLELALGAGDQAGAEAAGWDLLRFLAETANTGSGKSAAAASNVANNTLACMGIGFTETIDFTDEFGDLGAFEVVGGPSDLVAFVTTRDGFSGVEAPAGGFASWFGGLTVVYGQRVSDFVSGEEVIFSAIDWSIIQGQPQALNGQGVVGLCVDNPTDRFRIQEETIILPLVDPLFLNCSLLVRVEAPRPSFAGRLWQTVTDPFRPQPLYAALARGGTGGTAGGFSRFGVVNAGAVNLMFSVQPTDALVGEIVAPAVQMVATGNGGTALPEVAVSLEVILNNGEPLELLGTTNRVSGTDGILVFDDLVLTKPGVVIIRATASAPGFPTVTAISEPFHITQ